MKTDPGSLDRLHDIIEVASPSWWPLASGWYGLILIVLILLVWFFLKRLKHNRLNRYRRAALAELTTTELPLLPELLKRTAIHACTRKQVAALSGHQWRIFLDKNCDNHPFSGEAGDILDQLAYQPAKFDATNSETLKKAIRHWIKHHKIESC